MTRPRFCPKRLRPAVVALLLTAMLLPGGSRAHAEESLLGGEPWRRNGLATPRFLIQGTGSRNNPLRRPLAAPYAGDELFVRYRLRYQASTIDTPEQNNGEFFVLWLDAVEGADASTHSNGVPNIGLHVGKGGNRFMVRYASSAEKFGPPLIGDREYLIVGRLWKSRSGKEQPYDQCSLWVDPQADDEFSPDASAARSNSVSEVRWLGFSTGAKTEIDDQIEVWDIDAARSWQEILGLPPRPASEPPKPPEPTVAFRDDVFPILRDNCFGCHSGEDAEEGVRLDVLDEVLNQTAPYDAAESRLYQLAASGEMPPDGPPLKPADRRVLQAWIDEGLDWDETLLPTPVPQSDHWAFQPIRRPAVPPAKNQGWVRTPVDAFVARRHEALGVQPAPSANLQTLRRRLSLDLTGLPPAAVGLDVGEQPKGGGDEAGRLARLALNKDVDRLLNRPEYGVRWARHWLDVARWAESNGHQHNRLRPHAWRYRDWVVDAFRQNMPFDQFLRRQIAGDELQPYRAENVVATGFLAAARYSGNELDKEIQRNDILVDIVNTTTRAFLGLTMECAQCHSHKFDPVSQRDYYRFQAFFTKGQPGNIVLDNGRGDASQLVGERWEIFDTAHQRLVAVKRKQGVPEPILITPQNVVRGMRKDEKARYDELTGRIVQMAQSWSFYSPATAGRRLPVAPHDMRWPLPHNPSQLKRRKTRLLLRGDVKAKGPVVKPHWPIVFQTDALSGDPPARRRPSLQPPLESSLESPAERTRVALADWMTDPGNPLTARVWVNRIWQWHFGRGLVETSSDFGTQGRPPTHPGLLDYLAAELIDSGWDTNHIHRLILGSATWRQSSEHSESNAAADPDNRSLWRWTPRRLEAEAIRDSMLSLAGTLDPRIGGPSSSSDAHRRSLYLQQRRDHLPHQQRLFDSANGITSCARRRVSTSPLQPLWLLNSSFVQQASEQFARRVESVPEAFTMAVGRPPSADELSRLERLADQYGLESACVAILNLSEFLYIP